MTSSAKVFYATTPKNQAKIAYWFKRSKSDKAKTDALNYQVLTTIPNAVWNKLGVACFEDLKSAEEYRDKMLMLKCYSWIVKPE